MDSSEVNKTSDEIINELFSSLNVPLSPKLEVEEIIKREQTSAHTGNSENSEDDESDSVKSSESEIEAKPAVDGTHESRSEKVEKQKSQKKKKDKKKKKKKHRKKEDGGRHKHKKKRKKENFETAEEAKLASDVLPDMKISNQAFIQKVINEKEITHETTCSKGSERTATSKSPKAYETEETADCKGRRKAGESQSNLKADSHKEGTQSIQEDTILSLHSSSNSKSHKDIMCTNTSICEENTSKSVTAAGLTQDRSPEPVCVSSSTQDSPTASGRHKRKQSPRSCSPASVKKHKSSRSFSPSKPSSPEGVSQHDSPGCTERRSHSRSPSRKHSDSQSTRSESKSKRSRSRSRKRAESEDRSASKERSSKSRKKSQSKSKRRSRSRSRSRSRRSRSKGRSSSSSKRNARSSSRKRSGSRSRNTSKSKKRSRSRSRKRSRSRSRSTLESKSKRKSSESKRSQSRDRSRSRSWKESSSKDGKSASESRSHSRSASKSMKSLPSRYRKRSRSRSRKRSKSKSSRSRSRHRSRSPSSGRSRSKSSHRSSPTKESADVKALMRERANRLAELKSQGIPDGSLGSLLLSAAASVQSGRCAGVPHSVPLSDPKSIPLPKKDDPQDEDGGFEETVSVVEEERTAPVADDSLNSSLEQDSSKSKEESKSKQEEGNEKGKLKTIITIKSLKDSIVFQQAQEEAKRKAKEKVDEPAGRKGKISEADPSRQHQQEGTDPQQIQTEQDGETSRHKEDSEVKDVTERNHCDGKQGRECHNIETLRETENDFAKEHMEKKRDCDRNLSSAKGREARTEESDREKKTATRHESRSETGVVEESKGKKLSSDVKENMGRDNKQTSETEENKNERIELYSCKEYDDRENSRIGRKEDNKADLRKREEVKESKKGNDRLKVLDEYQCKGNNHSSKEVEGRERENFLCSSRRDKEDIREDKQLSKADKEKRELKKQSVTDVENCKGNKSSSITEGNEQEKNKNQSTKVESKEDVGEGQLEDQNDHPQLEQDSADKIEEGEIVSDKEDIVTTKSSSKSHSKKSKKDKSSAKEKKQSHKDKSKNKGEKKKSHDKKKEQDKDKVRSRSKERRKSKHSSSGSKEHSHSRHRKKRSRSHSHSREHSSRQHNRSNSRSRSRSRSKRRHESTSDLRDKVTRKRLLEIARRNAVYLMQNGCLPPSVEKEQLVKIKTGGKSVDELTDFCKQLVASGNYSDVDVVSEPSTSSEEDANSEKPFSSTRHPFSVKDNKPILMNIRNAPMLPTKTNAERLAGQAKLREQFPVSSGSQHRTKESEWVPVAPKEKKEEDNKVFTKPEAPSVDISQIVSTRLSAMRKLQDNPNDSEAIKALSNVQKEMQNWALSKQEPGQFTGTTGVKVLSQEELSSGHQAWARKEQFKEAAPVRPHFGLKMLQKMGWSPGEGLGKNKEGTTEPLLLDVKMDKKGFHAQEEVTPKKQPIPLVKDLSGAAAETNCTISGKHPVSALVELCSKRKWSPPDFEMVFDCGPDHKKNFLMKVLVNGQEFKPSVAASTKKMAKANAAAAYLQSLGLYPKDARFPLS